MKATSRQRSMLADAIEAFNEFIDDNVDAESLFRETQYTEREVRGASEFMWALRNYYIYRYKKEEETNGQS